VTAVVVGAPTAAPPAGQRRLAGVLRQLGLGCVLLAVAVAAWEVAKAVTGSDDRTMPHVGTILAQLGERTSRGDLYARVLFDAVVHTLRGAAVGLVLGAAIGVATGVLIARSRLVGAGLLPLVVAAQTVPIVAISPALVLWLGTAWTTKAAIAAYLTFFPVAVATARGLGAVPADSIDLLRTYGASRRTILRVVELPFALPLIMVGLETAAAFSVVGTIVAELPFGSREGLGVLIVTSWQFYTIDPAALYCVALAACLLGGLMVLAIRVLGLVVLGSRAAEEVL
jgi:NitT/TauT family transport system permease protein